MGRGAIITTVLPYLTDRPGQLVYAREIATDLSLNIRQVSMAIYNARRGNPTLQREIEVVITANAWRYRPLATLSPDSPDDDVLTQNSQTAMATTPSTRDHVPDNVQIDPVPSTPTRPGNGPRLFEEVFVGADGEILIKDELDILYVARKLS